MINESERSISDDVTALMARLVARETKLVDTIIRHQTELGEIRSTLAGLNNLRYPDNPKPNIRTREIIREYLKTLQSGNRIITDDILKLAESNFSWRSTARDRRAAFAACLSHMYTAGDSGMIKKAHGEYYKI